MSRRQAKYSRESLLSLKPYTDALPMIFKARYLHKEGRWCTFTQVEVLSPEHIGFLDCGHVNITRSVVEVHQPLDKSDHHRPLCPVVYLEADPGSPALISSSLIPRPMLSVLASLLALLFALLFLPSPLSSLFSSSPLLTHHFS